MLRNKGFRTVLVVVIGVLQFWDTGLFAVPSALQALALGALTMAAAAVVLPAGQLARLAMLIVAAIALTYVRMSATAPLNTLHLALFIPAIYVLFVDRWMNPSAVRP